VEERDALNPVTQVGAVMETSGFPLVSGGLAHRFQDMAPKDKALGQFFPPFTNIAGACLHSNRNPTNNNPCPFWTTIC